ncbi:hypothetical protein PUN28_020173 [Cardiocondyla obscurior]|uniref:Uncharacterized protein n=1 Tax=Cardiocondyla obscurior TaxID=286306 RepID=A0AAW2EB44_9HYME
MHQRGRRSLVGLRDAFYNGPGSPRYRELAGLSFSSRCTSLLPVRGHSSRSANSHNPDKKKIHNPAKWMLAELSDGLRLYVECLEEFAGFLGDIIVNKISYAKPAEELLGEHVTRILASGNSRPSSKSAAVTNVGHPMERMNKKKLMRRVINCFFTRRLGLGNTSDTLLPVTRGAFDTTFCNLVPDIIAKCFPTRIDTPFLCLRNREFFKLSSFKLYWRNVGSKKYHVTLQLQHYAND